MTLLTTSRPLLWVIRTIGALTFALAAVAGVTGLAFAHDDDRNETTTYGPTACTVVADLPVVPNATCIKHKTEVEDGVIQTKNSYLIASAAAPIQQAFLSAFQANGWTILQAEQDTDEPQWEYTVVKNQRQVEVKVEAQDPDEGTGTEVSISEE
jgi:hypothetical protein